MMRDAYKTETIERDGARYLVEWVYDNDTGTPWEWSDGHGIVTEWESRSKRSGELILAEDGRYRRFYDFAASVKHARKYWGIENRAHAAETVRRDYDYLRKWCIGDWHYCGIVVTKYCTCCDSATGESESLWGIEDGLSGSDQYHQEVINELINQLRTVGVMA